MSRAAVVLLASLFAVACAADSGASTTEPPVATSSAPVSSTSAPARSGRDIAWEEDLELLLERLPLVHPNPYWRVGESVFDDEVEALRAAIPTLTDDEIELELVRIMATIDGHTIVPYQQDALGYRRSQIRFYEFSDGVFVVASPDDGLIGGVLVSVNGVPAAEAIKRVSTYVSYDNEQTIKNLAPLYLTSPEMQGGAGILDPGSNPSYEIETIGGGVVEVEPELLPWEIWWEWVERDLGLPPRDGVFTDRGTDETFWWEYLPEAETIYIQYNDVRAGVGNMVDEIEELLGSGAPVERIVVDVRRNPGGNNTTFGPLVDFLDAADEAGIPVLGLLGRLTFSAAANFTTVLDVETGAVFFGEAIGGSPNLYGDTRPIFLPNSGVEVLVSSRYWEFGGPDDTRDTVAPDVPVEMSSSDYLDGLDPVFDAALSYEP